MHGPRRRLSLRMTFAVLAAAYALASAALAVMLTTVLDNGTWAIVLAPLILLPLILYHVRRAFAPRATPR